MDKTSKGLIWTERLFWCLGLCQQRAKETDTFRKFRSDTLALWSQICREVTVSSLDLLYCPAISWAVSHFCSACCSQSLEGHELEPSPVAQVVWFSGRWPWWMVTRACFHRTVEQVYSWDKLTLQSCLIPTGNLRKSLTILNTSIDFALFAPGIFYLYFL